MDFFFKEKEAPLLNSCPQRPLLWHLFPMLFPYLLNPSHQDSGSSTLPPGLSLFSGFFFFKFLIGLSIILWGLCSLMIHCLWKLKLGNRWLWTILMGLSLSRLLMPITALVIYCSSFIVFDWLCIVFCCLIGLLKWVLWKSYNFVLVVGYFILYMHISGIGFV